jgi:hypothetical protein
VRDREITTLRTAVLGVRFLCELGLLAALASWGFVVGEGAGAWALGLGAPALAAVSWGWFVSPKARRPVSLPTRLAIEIVLFALGALALWSAGARAVAVVLAVGGIATSVLNALTEPRIA